jgi:tellurite resistance-related uncharacterized protein
MTGRMLKKYLENRKEGYTYTDPRFPNIHIEFEFLISDENGKYIPEEKWEKFDAIDICFVNTGAILQVRVYNDDVETALNKVARAFNKFSKTDGNIQ